MIRNILTGAEHIYLRCGATDFRKQTEGLTALVSLQYHLDPFSSNAIFIFCNKKRNAIKVLRYDKNGFILAHKKLLEDMKFQWPAKEDDLKEITFQQIEWLLSGLCIEQKKAHHEVKLTAKNVCY